MTDLPIEVHEALDAVDHIGYLIRRFATIKDREAGEHLVRDLATIRSALAALAAREYSKQREEKLEREVVSLREDADEAGRLETDLWEVAVALGLDVIPGEPRLPERVGKLREELEQVADTRPTVRAIVDALRVLQDRTIGSPEACERSIDILTKGLAENSDTVPDGLGDRRPGA